MVLTSCTISLYKDMRYSDSNNVARYLAILAIQYFNPCCLITSVIFYEFLVITKKMIREALKKMLRFHTVNSRNVCYHILSLLEKDKKYISIFI